MSDEIRNSNTNDLHSRFDSVEHWIALLADQDGNTTSEDVWRASLHLCHYLCTLGQLSLSETLCRQLLSSIESKRGREDILYLRAQRTLLILLLRRRKWGQTQLLVETMISGLEQRQKNTSSVVGESLPLLELLAAIHHQRQRWDTATKLYSQVLKLNPNSAQIQHRLQEIDHRIHHQSAFLKVVKQLISDLAPNSY